VKKATKKAAVLKKIKKALPAPAPVKKTEVRITAAKGRPMLTWVGKRPLSHVTAFPAQHIETFDPTGSFGGRPASPDLWSNWPSAYPKGGLLFNGDNKEVLAHLLANGFRGKVNLIYIDPPFDSGADYVRKVSLRGAKGTAKLGGESYTLGEQIQYTDIWANDNYLQFMYERLMLLKELLAEDGAIVVHCDWHQGPRIRLVMDEIFAEENFRNEVIWHYGQRTAIREKRFDMKHDNLILYAKSESMTLHETTVPWSYEEFLQHRHDILKEEDGREFILTDGGQGGERYKRYVDEVVAAGKPLDSVWDLPLLNSSDKQRQGFPTQKPDYLLERLVRACSRPGNLILDCFAGSGTTAAVAQKLGRRWIGCDINKGAIQTTAKRLQTIIQEQIESGKIVAAKAERLPGMEANDDKKTPEPAQLAFTVWRVNDYDLAIQHNEAVNLTCEHIGIQRTRTDAYFDGTLGKTLVKIIPFGHPLTPLDLEELKRELDARPDEDRPITLVCLGMELAAKAWIEDWNRLRKGKDAVNGLAVIELRTDPKYGKFIKHEPARAKVAIVRKKDKLVVEIEDFISPTILERLTQQAGLLQPKIDDWRAMVDCVMIDSTYDGKVFNVALSDVPEKKSDLVAGRYELPAPNGKTTVAVKVIDMLGEEVFVTHQVPG